MIITYHVLFYSKMKLVIDSLKQRKATSSSRFVINLTEEGLIAMTAIAIDNSIEIAFVKYGT